MADLAQEQLRVLLLDIKNRLVGATLVYQGGANAIVIRLADCFREAVRVGAAAIVLAHNHPSSDATPSEEDVRVTREAAQVGDLLGIEVLDHIVIGGGRSGTFVSLRERGFYRPVSTSTRSKRKTATGCCRPTWETNRA
jgi:DNA repair protein RadC